VWVDVDGETKQHLDLRFDSEQAVFLVGRLLKMTMSSVQEGGVGTLIDRYSERGRRKSEYVIELVKWVVVQWSSTKTRSHGVILRQRQRQRQRQRTTTTETRFDDDNLNGDTSINVLLKEDSTALFLVFRLGLEFGP
jgi:hypothetical protein